MQAPLQGKTQATQPPAHDSRNLRPGQYCAFFPHRQEAAKAAVSGLKLFRKRPEVRKNRTLNVYPCAGVTLPVFGHQQALGMGMGPRTGMPLHVEVSAPANFGATGRAREADGSP